MEGHCCANTFVSGRNGQPGFIKAQDIFAEKINNCGKTSCTLIRMAGTKHEIFNAQDDILETYWGHVFGFLKG